MKKITYLLMIVTLSGCVSLTAEERDFSRQLEEQDITVDRPCGVWEAPASPAAAGALNLLPGFGNFYLASGNGGEGGQYLVGFANLLLWPWSILWGIPEATIDAQTINQRELNYYCKKSDYLVLRK